VSSYTVEHIALDIAFYHPCSTDLPIAEEVVEIYEVQKEHAEIFTQKETGVTFSQVEILNWFLMQTQTTIADHLPKAPNDDKPKFITFPIRFEPNTFSMQTAEGEQDLSHLKLMCKVILLNTDG